MNLQGKFIIIAKDGWPLEQIENRPVINFFRRLFLGSHRECERCYLNQRIVADPSIGTDRKQALKN